ncbi:MAG: type 1 periplasmic binding fold superfamily protein [Lentimicrobiaceae bacterium]|jgi:hypothetical protein|nr:type 1 periplasmic binding fold superfamily protein [Lentimicrobiaceae bacterium]MBT3454998.1 type 1 periplasmic binding fold superfamily protein [Lentimicrobiaceae bacterium]MBT3819017.1 type 1 periplasmic binding fold superfamily protein [Lentimicrobiaceae bacterium]MBT4060696.1 type 1 periplasmic binding fold superfamily protein [Lentimicrobiaceae bacterium]MBT4189965.1 type 1 periplasmic binding fold superfamily protein [Lentimicrobiaceae bacterium]
MNKFLLSLSVIAMSMLLFTGCKKDDPVIPNEEEVITTLNYTLIPSDGGTPVVLSFQDLDGDGGDPPVITGGTLAMNTTYDGSLELLNETETPPGDITEEVEEEALEHQFFFQTSIGGVSFTYEDTDTNGNPIGILTKVTTEGSGNGTITVILRHEPDKDASGVSNGDITNAGGETDIEVVFNVEVM